MVLVVSCTQWILSGAFASEYRLVKRAMQDETQRLDE